MNKEHVLIIGGSKGNGRTVVQTMAQRGYQVSVISRKLPQEKTEKAHYWVADMTKPGHFSRVFKEIIRKQGKLNHLVFCQKFRGTGDDWRGQIDTNLTAVKFVIESAIDEFEKIKGRNTVNIITSIAGRMIAPEQPVGYHVAKAGLEQMTRFYAVALGAKGIRVNAIAPNYVLKDENKDFYFRNKKIYDLFLKISPLGRMVTSQDVANTVAFLCSPQSAGISGQSLVIDGGVTLQEHMSLARKLMSLDGIPITQKNKSNK